MLSSFSQLHFGQAKQALELREHRVAHGPDATLGPYGPPRDWPPRASDDAAEQAIPGPLFAKYLKTKAVRWIPSLERRWLPFGIESTE
jgi:hypothetical protein